jgi:hypothetical protein
VLRAQLIKKPNTQTYRRVGKVRPAKKLDEFSITIPPLALQGAQSRIIVALILARCRWQHPDKHIAEAEARLLREVQRVT